MAFVGGELVSGYAAYFRARHGGANGLYIGGYANEVECYVPANNFLPPWRRRGEVTRAAGTPTTRGSPEGA